MVHPFIHADRINLQMSQPVIFATLSGQPPIFANTQWFENETARSLTVQMRVF